MSVDFEGDKDVPILEESIRIAVKTREISHDPLVTETHQIIIADPERQGVAIAEDSFPHHRSHATGLQGHLFVGRFHREQVLYHLTPLSEVQTKILSLLDFPPGIYEQLAFHFSNPASK